MSTPLGSSQLFSGAEFYNHQIDQSLRFENGDTPYLSRTPSSAGNRRTFTVSLWMKRGDLENFSEYLFHTSLAGANAAAYLYYSQDTLAYWDSTLVLQTTGVFRDPSAWYHVVLAVDTTQATASNRSKLYVNGEQITDLGTESQKSQNYDSYFNSTTGHYIGDDTSSTGIDGYVAEVNFIDGSALDPTSFGETKSGIWIPKAYTGSYGTNGFYLDFADGSALGDDESGNANDFTASGLAATDVVPDSPTNNFPTILPDKGGTSQVYSEGRLHANISSNSYAAKSSMFVPMDSGKWYVEALSDASGGSGAGLGTYTPNSMNTLSSISYYFTGNIILATDMIHYYSSGQIYNAGSSVQSSLTTVGDKDIIGMLIDTDAKTVQFYVNGTASGTAETMANTTDPVAAQLHGHNSRPFMFNFGVDSSFAGRKTSGSANATDANGVGDFYYSPPSGAKAICAKNLPAPTIDPLNDQTPDDHFKAVLYTSDNIGSGGTQAVTGVGFQPDWCWIKNRTSNSTSHTSYTSVQGAGKMLSPNNTNTEDSNSQYGYLSSFDSDGFTLTGGSTNANYINQSTDNYVSWNWLAGTSYTPTVTGGFSSPSASINTKAGFGIYKVTGSNSQSSFTHGLDATPEMIIAKNIDNAYNWGVFHTDLTDTSNEILQLNKTGGETNKSGIWVTINGTKIEVDSYAETASNGDYIYWVFHSVEGYSKMGTYEGNASNDGPFVFCGFRPAFLMVKTIDKAGGWHIYDNLRAFAGNEIDVRLETNADGENTSGPPHMDLLSNGFKLRSNFDNINPSSTMIFMAFAEQPFKFSNAR